MAWKKESKLKGFSKTQRRRNRIDEKFKVLQLLIPNSHKIDKACIIEEAIEYVKQLQLQVQMLSSPNKMKPSNTCMATSIPCSEMPQMCINMSLGFMGYQGTNMTTPSHCPLQWSNGFMPVPKGVQGQTIPPWANEQNRECLNHTVSLPMFNEISERNNACEAGSENISQHQPLQPSL
ncbi:hypothetical protein SUGI_0424790 [Cryptomeria japonica]|nr:hypothetical protein SUGI_0424790 [Cryptomeria japonica]